MDDDGLLLNIADPGDFAAPSGKGKGKKGGRWTERVKAKHIAQKRKTRHEDHSEPRPAQQERPSKRPRTEPKQQSTLAPTPKIAHTGRPTQIISSLFSSNPRLPKQSAPLPPSSSKKLAAPSNAPLTDSSTFQGLRLNPLISAHLASRMNIEKPTAIQRSVLANLLDPNPDLAARDVFIQSQTGSGKTLSFLLPIIQDLLPLSSLSYIDRSIGTLAVIIAPTRELAKQISDVLEALLKLRLRPEGTSADDTEGASLTRWLVSGLLTGGSTKTHEKARIRKGLPIIVATPGRLLDHLQHTESLNMGKCRWLVLDEADRLMELGFEETITGIIKGLDGRRNLALKAVEDGKSMEVGGWDWDRRRRTVLCSATIREHVQKLAGTALVKPLMVKAVTAEADSLVVAGGADNAIVDPMTQQKLTPPSQLAQKYVVVPLKLRLVALIGLLRSLVSQQRTQGSRIIVFLSCTDSVDFHWTMLGGTTMGGPADNDPSGSDSDDSDSEDAKGAHSGEQVEAHSPLLPGCSIYRLHGSLPTATRLSSLNQFTGKSRKSKGKEDESKAPSSSILLCTSVASRGLDLPLVQAVVQADLPTEGGATEYVHRIGRTARAGKGGEAWSFVSPSESEWVGWVEARIQDDNAKENGKSAASLSEVGLEGILCSGFSCKTDEFEDRATQVQLACERWVLRRKENASLARRAYQSHMRAYATHPSDEKHIFHIRHLHLGHLAKAFALRDAPSAVSRAQGSSAQSRSGAKSHASKSKDKAIGAKPEKERARDLERKAKKGDWQIDHSGDAERRMQEVVRRQGKLTRKGGAMVSGAGSADYQVPDLGMLEKLVSR